jgi:hypothetical protein
MNLMVADPQNTAWYSGSVEYRSLVETEKSRGEAKWSYYIKKISPLSNWTLQHLDELVKSPLGFIPNHEAQFIETG